jgi:hypothetical protein
MLLKTDGVQRAAWALRDPKTGIILTAHICEDEGQARKLRRAQSVHHAHLDAMDVVPILITVTAAD